MVQAFSSWRRAFMLSAILLVAACMPLTISGFPPYKSYVGQTVLLKEPMFLIHESEPSPYSHLQIVRPIDIAENRKPDTWTILGELPIGTALTITGVKWIRTNNSGGWVLAIGMIANGQGEFSGKRFTYYWGDETLNRAPWEDPSTPSERHVGSHGREYQGE